MVAVVFFGSNFVPVKKYETSDGMFFQWVLCSAIFLVGIIVAAIQGFEAKFEPIAMLGGFLWAIGNVMCVPVIKLIGLSLGLLIWGSTNMLIGWASGTFGLFGLKERAVNTPALNYAGVAVALVSLCLYIFIEPSKSVEQIIEEIEELKQQLRDVQGSGDNDAQEDISGKLRLLKEKLCSITGTDENDLEEPLNPSEAHIQNGIDGKRERSSSSTFNNLSQYNQQGDYAPISVGQGSRMVKSSSRDALNTLTGAMRNSSASLDEQEQFESTARQLQRQIAATEFEDSWIDKLPQSSKRTIGVALAAISGLFYGSTFDPPQWVIDNRGPTSDIGVFPGCGATASGDALDYVFPHFCGIWLTSTAQLIIYCIITKNKPVVNPQVILPGLISGIMWAIAQTSWFVANSALSFAVSFPMVTSGPGFVAAMWGVMCFREIEGQRNFMVLGIAFVTTVTAGLLIAFSTT